jgi:hypothetical protein
MRMGWRRETRLGGVAFVPVGSTSRTLSHLVLLFFSSTFSSDVLPLPLSLSHHLSHTRYTHTHMPLRPYHDRNLAYQSPSSIPQYLIALTISPSPFLPLHPITIFSLFLNQADAITRKDRDEQACEITAETSTPPRPWSVLSQPCSVGLGPSAVEVSIEAYAGSVAIAVVMDL